MRLAPLLVLFLSACGPPGPPPPPAFHADPPRTHYMRQAHGTHLLFEQTLINQSDSAQTLYAFAYAADNVAQPPARAVYPPRALTSMPHDRRFSIGNPQHGVALTLLPGDTARFHGILPIPLTWSDGQTIAAHAFRDFSLYLYDESGRNVLYRTWPLAD